MSSQISRRRVRAVAASLAVAALFATAVAPAARADALPPIDYSQYDTLLNTLGISNLPSGHGGKRSKARSKHQRRARRPSARRPTARQRAALRFRPRTSVTRRLYEQVSERSGVDPGTVATELDEAKAEFRRALRRGAGWRVHDLGDVAAFGLLQTYLEVRRVDDPPRRGLRVLRRAVRDDLAKRRSVRRLPDSRKQAIAERLELRVIFLISDITGAQMRHDSRSVAAARRAMRAWAKHVYGVDVGRIRLTRRGLVKR